MSGASSNSGFRILLLDTKSENPNHYICLAIRDALKEMAGVDRVVKADYSNAVSLAVKNDCNLFLAFDAEALDRLICSRVTAICGTSVLWVTEDPYEMSVNVANADLFDLVFTNDSGCVGAYGEKGRHLPLAGAKPFHFLPVQEDLKKLRYDIFFAGTAWPNRVALLKQALEANWGGEGVKAKIALPTNRFLPPRDLPLPLSQIDWRTSPADFAAFANTSLSTLVLPRVFSASGNKEFAETPPPRLYEAALAGTVQLVQSKLKEAGKYFEPGKEFLYFDTAKDLVEKMAALRVDMNWRNQIAHRAQEKALAQHCYENRMARVLEEVKALPKRVPVALANPGKPKILFVVHNVVGNIHFGGVEVYLKHISAALIGEYEPYFYMSNPNSHPTTALVYNSQGDVIMTYQFSRATSYWQLSCAERENAFASVLTKLNISLVHFHHFIGHVPSLAEVARALGVPTAMTIHDFYSICNEFMLLSFKGDYCHPDQISLSQCDVCLSYKHQIYFGGQAARRTYWDKLLGTIGTLIFNTAGSRDLLAKIYPSVAAHKHLEVLPVPTDPVSPPPARNKLSEKRPLKVASLGNFLFYKGGDTIARVIPFFRESNIEFHIFGLITEQYEYLKNSAAFPFVRIHGVYQPGQLPEEINTCDVSLHLSTWPETYCMSLSEAWDRGLVPIVTDIGALGERVTDGVNGLKIRPDSEGDLEQAIRRLMETPGLLETLRKNIKSAPISRTDTHVAGLKKIYSQAIAQSQLLGRPLLQADFLQFWHPAAANWAVIDQEAAAAVAAEKAVLTAKKTDSQRFKFVRRVIRHIEVHGLGSLVRKSFERVRNLARKVVRHLREKGIVSMLRRSVGYVKEKL